jgi:4-amino-4-deoxy-L-arabinose transferase-like glycosyltransferase
VLETLLVGLLTAIALAVRLYQLSDIPPGFHGDEAAFGLEAKRVASGDWLGIWTPVTLGHATGHIYWTALLFKLGEPSIFTVRLAMVLLGALTVPVAYLLFRLLFSRPVALLAATLIAFSSWHLVYSRAGWTIVPAVFLLLLSMYLFFLGLDRKRLLWFLLGGIFLGFGFYTHKNFPVYYAAVWTLLLPRVYFSANLRERTGSWLFLLFSLLAAIPFLSFFLQNRDMFIDRLEIESFFNRVPYIDADSLWEKIKTVSERVKDVLLYVHSPVPRDFVDGTGGRPLIDRASESFFWLGFLVVLLRIRQLPYQFVLIGLLAGAVPSIIAVTGEERRLLAAMPFVMLCVALGLDASLRVLWRLAHVIKEFTELTPRLRQVLGQGAAVMGLAGFLAFFSFGNTTYHFKDWASQSVVKWVYVNDFVQAIDYLKGLDPETYVYFYSQRWSYNYETRQFLLPDMRGEDRSQEFGSGVSLGRRHDGPVVYVLVRDYARLLPEIQLRYPNGASTTLLDTDGSLIFSAYLLGEREALTRR